jgi:hypothetical protein
MNKRIKELHDQACKLDWEQYPNSIPDGERIQQTFAELIVRECARCVTQPTIQAAGQTDIAIQALQDVLANDMKAYFGVE